MASCLVRFIWGEADISRDGIRLSRPPELNRADFGDWVLLQRSSS